MSFSYSEIRLTSVMTETLRERAELCESPREGRRARRVASHTRPDPRPIQVLTASITSPYLDALNKLLLPYKLDMLSPKDIPNYIILIRVDT